MNAPKNYLIHPQVLIIYLVLIGISSLFIAFSAAFMYNRVQAGLPPIALPSLFYFNTLILLGSSLSLIKVKEAYQEDNTEKYKRYLLVTLGLSLLFLVLQILAWMQLINMGIHLRYSNMASYMYVISFIHFMHLIVGIPFLGIFYYTAIKKMKEPISVAVYFADDTKSRNLRLLTIYWHFLDILWIYLVVFFLLNFLVK